MVILTILALLSIQTQLFHTHAPHSHSASHADIDQHHSEFHLGATDLNDDEHDVASEVDLSSKAVVKNIKFSASLLAVLALIVILFVPSIVSNQIRLVQQKSSINNPNPFLRPPAHAPPY